MKRMKLLLLVLVMMTGSTVLAQTTGPYEVRRTGSSRVMPDVKQYLEQQPRTAAAAARDNQIIYIESEGSGPLELAPGQEAQVLLRGQNVQRIGSLQAVANEYPTSAVHAELGSAHRGDRVLKIQVRQNARPGTQVDLAFRDINGRALPVPVKVAVVPREQVQVRGRLREQTAASGEGIVQTGPVLAAGGTVITLREPERSLGR